jgi:hypothetical protein
MTRNVCIKLFIGFAILWQLFGLMYQNGSFATSSNIDLLIGRQEQKLDSPHSINTNGTTDATPAPLPQRPKTRKIGDDNDDSFRFNRSQPRARNIPSKAPEKFTANESSPTIKLRQGWKLAKTEPGFQNAKTTTINATTFSSIRNECFAYNSDQWIRGNIFSNNDNGVTPGLLDDLLEGPENFRKLPNLFDQTICHRDSPLRDFSPKTLRGDTDRLASTEDWYHRFLYLALHWKFHRPALNEYRTRKRCAEKGETQSLQSFMEHNNIREMDFECRGEKYVVIPVGSIGFGAYLNTQASLCILLALRTNRIPIFSSKSFFPWQKRKGYQDPWLLAPSHCHRKDLQCYFLPVSPCTVTNEELEAAPIFGSNRKEQKFLAKNLTIPPELERHKIVVVNSGLSAKTEDTPEMRQIASAVVEELFNEWKKAQREDNDLWSDEDLEALELAHRWVTEKTQTDPIGLLRQVYVYILRPNPHYRDILERQMTALVPQAIDPSDTIGMAIRGSDKCLKESMCLSFERYMELATDIAYPAMVFAANTSSSISPVSNIRPKLIMTTEDPKVFNDSLVYQHNNSFPFEFLVNDNDNMQGSGYPKEFSRQAEMTIVSSLMALKFHFNAGQVYLNCCSNFHLVLNYLLQSQCGARRHGHNFVFHGNGDSVKEASLPPPVARCLGEEEIPRRFRICCNWSKNNGVCGDIWKEYLREKEENNLLVKNDNGGMAIIG